VFEVTVDPDNVTSIVVDEGVVVVEHRLLPGKAVPLTPGESLRVFPNASLAVVGVNKLGVAARVAEIARDALYTLGRLNGGSGRGSPGPAQTPAPPSPPPPLPGDRKAPPPPPPPSPKR
ncbi:MAG: hypothetical protein HY236_05775, partial [Acidobacteria bacterium]|nr:hypothetical protein [Acidobacteriota bacterium]